MKRKVVACLILSIFLVSGCTAYKSQFVSFRPPEGYPNYRVVGGAILGAAIGIVSGKNVGSALGKGAALGGAGGAIIGGVQEGTSGEREHTIIDDIRDKGLEGKVIPKESLANGFIFFPGEAASAKELRLQYREKGTGSIHSVVLRLK